MFSTVGPVDKIHHARPFMSTWPTRLVATEACKQVDRSTREDSGDSVKGGRPVAHTNSHKDGVHVITWPELLVNFNIRKIHEKYSVRLPAHVSHRVHGRPVLERRICSPKTMPLHCGAHHLPLAGLDLVCEGYTPSACISQGFARVGEGRNGQLHQFQNLHDP
ncbi:hypothetical protein K438DRAFT_2102436, partial [Mycena galopus ATCC 62051]